MLGKYIILPVNKIKDEQNQHIVYLLTVLTKWSYFGGCQHTPEGAGKAKKVIDSTEILPHNWQVICSMMVLICPIMASVCTVMFHSLSLRLQRTVCPTSYQPNHCLTMPHYQVVILKKPCKLRSETAAQLTPGHYCVSINEFFLPLVLWMCMYMMPFGSVN